MRRWVRGRGGECEHIVYRPPPSGVYSPRYFLGGGSRSWDGRSRTCYESSHECLSPLTSKPLVPRNHAGHPRSVTIDRLSSQKLKPEQCRRVLCKGRDNCNLPSENCQVVSASEFCSHTTVTYQSLTSPARALGPVDIQEFNEPELALTVCIVASWLALHKFNISLKKEEAPASTHNADTGARERLQAVLLVLAGSRGASESRESRMF